MTTEATAVTTPVRARLPNTEVTVPTGRSPADMLAMAIQQNVDPAFLRELLAVQREWEAGEAKKAYVVAMAAFKTDCPSVLSRDKTVSFESRGGKTSYRHATLGHIVDSITPHLSKHGLHVSFQTEQSAKVVSVTCHVTHTLGHRESTTLVGPNDESGNKNMIQAVGSAVTYLQRYTLLSLLGLATADQDDDGFTAEVAGKKAEAAKSAADVLARKTPPPEPDMAAGEDPTNGGSQERPENIAVGKVSDVSKKQSPPDAEKPWTRYGIKVNGVWFSTFDEKAATVAKTAKDTDAEVEIDFTRAGKYTNLNGIRIIGAAEEAEEITDTTAEEDVKEIVTKQIEILRDLKLYKPKVFAKALASVGGTDDLTELTIEQMRAVEKYVKES